MKSDRFISFPSGRSNGVFTVWKLSYFAWQVLVCNLRLVFCRLSRKVVWTLRRIDVLYEDSQAYACISVELQVYWSYRITMQNAFYVTRMQKPKPALFLCLDLDLWPFHPKINEFSRRMVVLWNICLSSLMISTKWVLRYRYRAENRQTDRRTDRQAPLKTLLPRLPSALEWRRQNYLGNRKATFRFTIYVQRNCIHFVQL